MTNAKIFMVLLVLLLHMFALDIAEASENENMVIDGALVKEPCTMNTAENSQTIDFGTIVLKGLYKDIRTQAKPFSVILSECDTELGESVNLILSGPESAELKGYLSTEGIGSQGIVIGIETPEGSILPINLQDEKTLPAYSLSKGITTIPLQAYVRAVPDAIKLKNLTVGAFSASLTLGVSYP